MKNLKLLLLATVFSVSAYAQGIKTPQPSPTATLIQEVGLGTITVKYSRPSAKGRVIFGGLERYGSLWRTGANSATKFTFSDDFIFDGTELKAGDYAMLTVPGETEWKVNLYAFDGPGVGGYTEKTPAASATVTPTKLTEAVETFTIDINNLRNSTATIDLIWQNVKVSVPVDVKTDAKVMAQIEGYEKNASMNQANDYHGAAAYLLAEKKELQKALDLVNKAVAIRADAFWMLRTKSLIQAELGLYKEAIATAQASLQSATEAKNQNYIDMNNASIAEWSKKKTK